MPKTVYQYVLFLKDDPAQLPIRYLNISEVSYIVGKSKANLHNIYQRTGIIYHGLYGIEKFRKEVE